MIKLSKTSKLGCLSWSLQAGETCPGSYDKGGNLVPACAGCYAKGGNYRFKNVVSIREQNKQDWQRVDWVQDMVTALAGQKHFRWFDSGDVYSANLAEKILAVMEQTPWVSHWLPTRMMKFPKFQRILAQMQALPNVSVRFSSDSVTGEFTPGLHGSTIVPSPDAVPEGAKLCSAYANDGQCGTCRACWDKSIPVIAYPAHGVSMKKVIRLALAA